MSLVLFVVFVFQPTNQSSPGEWMVNNRTVNESINDDFVYPKGGLVERGVLGRVDL